MPNEHSSDKNGDRATHLKVGDEGHSVVHGHAADQEVVLDEPRVVVGEVHHQINVTIANESVAATKGKSEINSEMPDHFLTVITRSASPSL